ncbi:MAG: hypothetical protein ACJAXM_000080 [Arenicella sp.]|jgi:hypothetical protein
MKIDFVLTWVDGNDPKWLAELEKYSPKNKLMNGKDKFRDWNNLQYLFRAFETFTPWVNKIFFVTYGHIPTWLDLSHPKLVIVKHEDYMDVENLPVFSSHPIELNLHRIKGLSEHFVYFNDDCFILQKLAPEIFFKNALPVDAAIGNIMNDGIIAPIVLNGIDLINKNFNRHKGQKLTKNQIIRSNFWLWFTPHYRWKMLDTLLLMKWRVFSGFVDFHQAQAFLKSTFEKVWQAEPEILQKTSKSKFRNNMDVNQYLFRYWQLVTGSFTPGTYKNIFIKRKRVELRSKTDVELACNDIRTGNYHMYCLNDAMSKGRFTEKDVSEEDLSVSKVLIIKALHNLLPGKSRYEL